MPVQVAPKLYHQGTQGKLPDPKGQQVEAGGAVDSRISDTGPQARDEYQQQADSIDAVWCFTQQYDQCRPEQIKLFFNAEGPKVEQRFEVGAAVPVT